MKCTQSYIYAQLFFLLVLVSLSEAREGSMDVNVEGQGVYFLFDFGFHHGGYASVNASISPSTYSYLIACTDDGWRMMYENFFSTSICINSNQTVENCIIGFDHNGMASIEFNINTTNTLVYYFGFINCDVATEVTVDYLLENPDGQQLSWQYIPLEYVYLAMTVLWFPTTLLWCANWIRHRQMKNRLHRVISLYPISKLLWVSCSSIFWYIANKDPTIEVWMTTAYSCLYLISLGLLVMVFLLIARGWCIVSDEIGKSIVPITICVVALVSTEAITIIFGGLFQFFVLACYAVIVFMIFTSTNQSLLKLERQRANPVENSDVVGVHMRVRNAIDSKKRMLRSFNVAMVVFFVAQITLAGLQALIFKNSLWITRALFELVDWLMFVVIGITFRLRTNNVYYRMEGAAGGWDKFKSKKSITWADVEDEEEEIEMQERVTLLPGMAAS